MNANLGINVYILFITTSYALQVYDLQKFIRCTCVEQLIEFWQV